MRCSCRHCSDPGNPAPGRSGGPPPRPSVSSAPGAAPSGSRRNSATSPNSRRQVCAGCGRPSPRHSANRHRSRSRGGRASRPRPRRVSHKSADDHSRQPAQPTGPELADLYREASYHADRRRRQPLPAARPPATPLRKRHPRPDLAALPRRHRHPARHPRRRHLRAEPAQPPPRAHRRRLRRPPRANPPVGRPHPAVPVPATMITRPRETSTQLPDRESRLDDMHRRVGVSV